MVAVLLRVEIVVDKVLRFALVKSELRRRGAVAVILVRSLAVKFHAVHALSEAEGEAVTLHALARAHIHGHVNAALAVEDIDGLERFERAHLPFDMHENLVFAQLAARLDRLQGLDRVFIAARAHEDVGDKAGHLRQGVVVDGRAEEVGQQGRSEALFAVFLYRNDRAVFHRVDGAARRDDRLAALGLEARAAPCLGQSKVVFAQDKLLIGDNVSLGRVKLVFAQHEPDVANHFALFGEGGEGEGIRSHAAALSGNGYFLFAQNFAFAFVLHGAVKAVQGSEHKVVDRLERFVFELEVHHAVLIFDLVEGGVGGAVGAHDAVEGEASRVGRVAEVAAVAPFVLAVLGLAVNGLVGKVPDKAAREPVVLAELIPIVGEVAQRVAHAVRVFAFDKGQIAVHFGRIFGARRRPERDAMAHGLVLADDGHFLHLGIHLAQNVARLGGSVRFVMDKARLVHFEDLFLHYPEILAVARLVAQRPADDAGVVAQPAHHVAGAVDALIAPALQALGNEHGKSVRFEVGLRHDEHAVLVAKLIKNVLVGVVAVADGGDVVLLAKFDVRLDEFARHGVTVVRMELVAVDAAYLQGLAVEQDERSLAVGIGRYAYLAEAELAAANVRRLAVHAQSHLGVVKGGIFMRPKADVFHGRGEILDLAHAIFLVLFRLDVDGGVELERLFALL